MEKWCKIRDGKASVRDPGRAITDLGDGFLETKQEIRQQILKIRRQMSQEEWAAGTAAIQQKVIACDVFREATDLFCYMDFQNEVGTKRIIEEAWRLGKSVWLPRVEGKNLEFYEAHDFSRLIFSKWGIAEPDGSTEKAWGSDGLVLMPGVAFDRQCRRIGYGGGYYDRYLTAHPHLDTMAVAFDIQMMEQIPEDPHDISPAIVLTETLDLERPERNAL